MKRLMSHIIKSLEKRNLKCYEDMLLCMAVSLASAFYYFDTHNSFSAYFSPVLTGLVLLCWIMCAIRNGFLHRFSFVVFSIAYWLIPQIFIFWYNNNDNVHNYSSMLRAAQRYSELLVKQPIEHFTDWLDIDAMTFAIIFVCVINVLYSVANFLRTIFFDGMEEGNTPQ